MNVIIILSTRIKAKLIGRFLLVQEKQTKTSADDQNDTVEEQDTTSGGQNSVEKFKGWLSATKVIREWHVTSKNIDRMSRRMFPLGFLIFNVIFWLLYVVLYPDVHATD